MHVPRNPVGGLGAARLKHSAASRVTTTGAAAVVAELEKPVKSRSNRRVSGAIALLAVIAAACGSATESSPAASGSAPAATADAPDSTASPRPSAGASPSSTRSESPTDLGVLYPWLPEPDAGVPGALEPDSLVTALDTVPVSEVPGGEPYRYDTGDPDPATHPLMGFGKGYLLVVLHGPIIEAGVAWYLLTTAHLSTDVPTGWSPIASEAGLPYFAPATFSCPTSPIPVESLEMLTDGLPACYGRSEITIVGDLACSSERPPEQADPWVTGAPWLAHGACTVDAPVSIYGLDSGVAPGRYEITGHFDDPAASTCRAADGDVSPPAMLNAVLQCRRAFVATGARPSSVVVPATLEYDTVASVVVDNLRVRAEPGVAAPVVPGGRLSAGTRVLIQAGPAQADGYDWFQVQPLDAAPGGWVAAAARDGSPWLAPGGLSCPEQPLSGVELLTVRTLAGLACFKGKEVEMRGDVTCVSSDVDIHFSGPAWLLPERACEISIGAESMLFFHAGLPELDRGFNGPAAVIGHWDDPAARECVRIAGPETDLTTTVTACRSLFVATQVKPTG